MTPSAAQQHSTMRRIGPYVLLHPLGQGTSASVFLAEHKDLKRRVAIKIMRPERDVEPLAVGGSEKARRLSRFVREGRTLSRLAGHPGIVRVLDCRRNKAKTRAYLVMEYVEGLSLHEWQLRRSQVNHQRTAVPIDSAIAISRQIAEALSFVHSQGVIHRDVKPANIIIRMCNDSEAARQGEQNLSVTVVDFGLAKQRKPATGQLLDPRADLSVMSMPTADGELLGTVGYMAPEQCKGEALTDRADVYALGVILFELLVGTAPFVGRSQVEVLIQHVEHEPPSLTVMGAERGVSIPRWLSELVSAMLDKDPHVRPDMATVAEMLRSPPADAACPLPGLNALKSEDADLHIGRSQEAGLIAGWIRRAVALPSRDPGSEPSPQDCRWIVISGSAGVGKTSFVQAELIPLLQHPSQGLTLDIEHTGAVSTAAADWLSSRGRTQTRPLVLILDQVERLLSGPEDDRVRFSEQLAKIMTAPGRVAVVTVVRREALARLLGIPALRNVAREVCELPPLSPALLSEVMSALCRRGRMRLGDGLRERIVRDAQATSVPLGLIQLFFQVQWKRKGAGTLSLSEYEQIVGDAGLVRFLADSVEGAVGSLSPPEQRCARNMILALVLPGRGLPDTRRSRSSTDLLRAADSAPEAETTLRSLCGEGTHIFQGPPLLVCTAPGESTDLTLVHDAVLSDVPTIAGWIAEERPGLEYVAQLEEMALAWQKNGTRVEDLPQGSLLKHYTERQALLRRVGSSHVLTFMAAALDAEQRRRRNRIRLSVLGICAVVIITVAAGIAWKERATAVASAGKAAEARERATEHLQQVLRSVDQIAADTDWDLAVLPDASGNLFTIRRSLLEAAEARLRDAHEEELNRPGVRLARIRVRQRLADLAFGHLGLQVAEDWLRLAQRDIESELQVTSTAAQSQARLRLALNWSKLGKVQQARGRQGSAVEAFERSIEILRQLRDSKESNVSVAEGELWLSLATSSVELGVSYLSNPASVADDARGVALLSDSLELYRQAGSEDYHHGLAADAQLYLVEHWMRKHRLPESRVLLRNARDVLLRLLKDQPSHMGWRIAWLRSQYLEAQLLAAEGQKQASDAKLAEVGESALILLKEQQPGSIRQRGYFVTIAQIASSIAEQPRFHRWTDSTDLKSLLCRMSRPLVDADPDDQRVVGIAQETCRNAQPRG